jgi:hypothetical protein
MQHCFCPDDKIHERRNEAPGPSGSLSPCLPVSLSSDPPGSLSPHIFLAVPHYNGLEAEALPSLIQASATAKVKIRADGCSLLAHNFNRLWCQALNERFEHGFTHFAMHHADQGAAPGWLDVLLEELDRHEADVISVIVPLKDGRGLTSTAIYDHESARIQRLTMREAMTLPPTFTKRSLTGDGWLVAGDGPGTHHPAPATRHALLVNTGLWLCRLDRPWVENFPGFQVCDGVRKRADGRWQANVFSEDWNASAWWDRHGVKVAATRKVRVRHIGKAAYGNQDAWGEWSTDKGES